MAINYEYIITLLMNLVLLFVNGPTAHTCTILIIITIKLRLHCILKNNNVHPQIFPANNDVSGNEAQIAVTQIEMTRHRQQTDSDHA